MELTLIRKQFGENYTIGELLIDGVRACDTLEPAVRPEKIPGLTAIPAGRYELKMTYSKRFCRVMPQLMNVPGFEGIRIHTGNIPADTQGCIIVGKDMGNGTLKDSRTNYNILIYDIENDKSPHWITVK